MYTVRSNVEKYASMYVGKLQTALMYRLSMIYCHSCYRTNVRDVGGIFIGQKRTYVRVKVVPQMVLASQNRASDSERGLATQVVAVHGTNDSRS
uniref:Uncharacterized protein n=1 Tax=Podoviridae sp. ct2nF21 TaxID=2826537 RepID=A0A8S5NFV1_9CAUD|nr:MAG TPA: hypothetical protein [Podoviridae sp. ct2nF21]